MSHGAVKRALALYDTLPRAERFHVKARAFSAPLVEVAARVPGGAVADVGCGHGLLTALLAQGDAGRTVHGVDPDERKISWARRALSGVSNAKVEQGTVESLAAGYSGTFDAVVVCDVLYLLPEARWPGFLRAVRSLLKPGGRFLLKEAEGDGSWKHYKGLLQEWVMVSLLRRTKAGGGMVLKPRDEVVGLLGAAGFSVREVVDLGRGYTTPHVLYAAEASAP